MKLSIIVPVYNVAPYLRKCVDSLLAQDYDDYEIILVDDGSTDDSWSIIQEYISRFRGLEDERIRGIHQENGGLSAARNTGIAAARGEYLCFVDSDDYWEPNVLGGLMAQVERDNLDVLRYRLQYVRIKNEGVSELVNDAEYEVYNPYKSDPFKDNDYSEEVADGVTFLNTRMSTACYAWAFILRRDLIIPTDSITINSFPSGRDGVDLLFTPGIYFEDTDWTPRMLVKAKRVASTNTVVYNYLQREGSITKAVNRTKLQKVLDDKMRLIGEMQRQAEELKAQGCDHRWYQRMIAETVISIINILSTTFYSERRSYISRLHELRVFPISSRGLKTRLINLSPRLAVEMMHIRNG